MKARCCGLYRLAARWIARRHSGTNRFRPYMNTFRRDYRHARPGEARAAFAEAWLRARGIDPKEEA